MSKSLIEVGDFDNQYNRHLGINLPEGKIYRSGLEQHMRKHGHEDDIPFIEKIPEILSAPDYVGSNPREPDSMEYVKTLDKNVLVAVKYDTKNDYLYVASLYSITDSKMQNRLYSKRLMSASEAVHGT